MANMHKPLCAYAHVTVLEETTLPVEKVISKHALWSVGMASPYSFLLAAS